MGVETVHDGYGKGSVWKWSLPLAKVLKIDKDAHTNGMSTIDNNEHLYGQNLLKEGKNYAKTFN